MQAAYGADVVTLAFGLSWYRELPESARPGQLHLVDAFIDHAALCRTPVSGPEHSVAHVPAPRMGFAGDGVGEDVPPGAVCVRCAAKLERMLQTRLSRATS